MKHAQTIAMARGLLADGRPTDVARMIEPLLTPAVGGDGAAGEGAAGGADAGEVLLRALLARVRLLRYGDPGRALDLLGGLTAEVRDSLPPEVRAEVALWLGWAHAWPARPGFDAGRALHLLGEAEQLFRETANPAGRGWVALGRAQAYLCLDEPPLLAEATETAVTLPGTQQDVQANLLALRFRIETDRFRGHLARARARADRLTLLGHQVQDPLAEGSGLAYRALLDLERGAPPDAVLETARQAERTLTRAAVHPGLPLLLAVEAQLEALYRANRPDEAERLLARTAPALHTLPGAAECLEERAIAWTLHGGTADTVPDSVQARIDDLLARVHRSSRRRQEARVLRLVARSLADPAQADAAAERAALLAHDAGDERAELAAWLTRAWIWQAAGDPRRSRAHLHQAERLGDYFSLLPLAAERAHLLAHLARLEHHPDAARRFALLALTAYRLLGDQPAQHRLARDFPDAGEAASEDTAELIAHAAVSVPLVARVWLDRLADAVPAGWMGLYQQTETGTWQRIGQQGTPPPSAPEALPTPDDEAVGDIVWTTLQGIPGTAFRLGLHLADDDPAARASLQADVTRWMPLVHLALNHAVLRARRLDTAFPHEPADDDPHVPLLDGVVYASPAMCDLARTIRQARTSHCPVLFTGERGTGKEHLARALHRLSERQHAPFVVFDDATLSPDLVEAALFGSAATGHAASPALFEQAHGGTLYIREITDLPREVQTRLLHYLESGDWSPAGSSHAPDPDVRIMAATSHPLHEVLHDGRLLEPLYYRLSVLHLSVPPLRERREDIPLLARHFLRTLQTPGTPLASITSDVMEVLCRYAWPGNVRQLRNELERALTAVRSEPAPMIDRATLSPLLRESVDASSPIASARADRTDLVPAPGESLDDVLARAEKAIIERVLTDLDGQVSASAQALGLTRQGLYKKMKRLGIDPAAFQSPATPSLAVS